MFPINQRKMDMKGLLKKKKNYLQKPFRQSRLNYRKNNKMPIQNSLIEDFYTSWQNSIPYWCAQSGNKQPRSYSRCRKPGPFTDEERAVVGTRLQRQSPWTGHKNGLDYFGPKMRGMVETIGRYQRYEVRCTTTHPIKYPAYIVPLISYFTHCWRGGMRSAGGLVAGPLRF